MNSAPGMRVVKEPTMILVHSKIFLMMKGTLQPSLSSSSTRFIDLLNRDLQVLYPCLLSSSEAPVSPAASFR